MVTTISKIESEIKGIKQELFYLFLEGGFSKKEFYLLLEKDYLNAILKKIKEENNNDK